MKRKKPTKFGRILRSLRQELVDHRTGKVLSQVQLSLKANLPEQTVGKIERGEQTRIDGETLVKLADALGLNALARREFFAAALEIEQWSRFLNYEEVEAAYENILSDFVSVQSPAYLFNSLFDVLCVNTPMMNFHNLSRDFLQADAEAEARTNILIILFDPDSPLRMTMGNRWKEIALSNLLLFRISSLPYRYTTRYDQLIARLFSMPDFRSLWFQALHAEGNFYSRARAFRYNHGGFGLVDYMVTTTTTLTSYGPLYLSTLVPCHERTTELFRELAHGGV